MQIGPFVKCPHPEMIEAIGQSELDFAVVDMEHTPLGPRDLYPLVLAAERHHLPLTVRIPRLSEEYVKWCLDLGVREVQVPHITSPEDVRAALHTAYFAPLGERGLCRFVRAARFSALGKDAYLDEANQLTRLVLQLEGVEAIRCLRAILEELLVNHSRTTLPSMFIGPYDLSQSLGIPGEVWDRRVTDLIGDAIDLCKEKGFSVGTFTDSLPDGIHHWHFRGVDFLQYASDLNMFLRSAREVASVAHDSDEH